MREDLPTLSAIGCPRCTAEWQRYEATSHEQVTAPDGTKYYFHPVQETLTIEEARQRGYVK